LRLHVSGYRFSEPKNMNARAPSSRRNADCHCRDDDPENKLD
jgi:hypothetical protein